MNNVEELTEVVSPVDQALKARIVKIRKGKVKDLVDIPNVKNEEIRKRFERDAERDAIELTLDLSGVMITRVLPISLRSNSRFMRLLRKYKRIKVGDEIDVTITRAGRIQILYD